MSHLPSYAFRASLFVKEKKYTANHTNLVIEEAETGKVEEIPLKRIQNVQLAFANSKNAPDTYFCTLQLDSKRKIQIKSLHFRGIADFEQRTYEYNAFVEGLHKQLANIPGVAFKRGIDDGLYRLMWAISIFAGLMMIGMTLFMIFSTIILGIVMLVATPFVLMRLRDYLRKNKPGVYDPKQLPQDLMAQ